jgi:hypothetical protein
LNIAHSCVLKVVVAEDHAKTHEEDERTVTVITEHNGEKEGECHN